MNATSKRAALRSLNRVLADVCERLAFREKHRPTPGSVEMGHLLGLQDGSIAVENEIRRVTKLRTT